MEVQTEKLDEKAKATKQQTSMIDADSGFVDEFIKEINIMNDINSRFEKDVIGRTNETIKRSGLSEEDILRFPPSTMG